MLLPLRQLDGDAGGADLEAPRPATGDVPLALACVVQVQQLGVLALAQQLWHDGLGLEGDDRRGQVERVDNFGQTAARLAHGAI